MGSINREPDVRLSRRVLDGYTGGSYDWYSGLVRWL
jgi:hypothetical protein